MEAHLQRAQASAMAGGPPWPQPTFRSPPHPTPFPGIATKLIPPQATPAPPTNPLVDSVSEPFKILLDLGPERAGYATTPCPPDSPFQAFLRTVGNTLGVPGENLLLKDSAGETTPITDREGLDRAQRVVVSLSLPPYNLRNNEAAVIWVYDGSMYGFINAPGLQAAHNIPAGLSEILGIPPVLTGAWKPREYEEGMLWCFLPTETLVSETGWTTRVVKCNLRRGCIEANPGPRHKNRGSLASSAPQPRQAPSETPSALLQEPDAPSHSREGTIMEGIAAVTSPQHPPLHASSSHAPPPYSHRAGLDPPDMAPSATPPHTQGAGTEQGNVTPSPDSLAQLLDRGSLRKLYAVQCPAWKDYVKSICSDFLRKSQEGKTKIAWDLLLGVKRFLFFPEDKLSQRQLARELRKRAHLEGSESIAPNPLLTNSFPRSVIKGVIELIRAGAFSRAAKILEAPLDPPANPATAGEQVKRLHPAGGPYNTPKFVYEKECHGPLPSAADVVRKATSLAPLRAPGPSGWTKELLVPILQEDDPRDVVTWIIQGILTSSLPPTMRDFLTGANLKLFNKPGASVGHHSSYRPIAMGEVILKLAGLLALEQVRDHLPAVFQGLQFGAQYTQGCEHVVCEVRDHFRDRPDEVVVAVDLENAFNSISRAAIFRALKRYPNLSPMLGISLFGYGTPSKLHLGEGIAIPSSRGGETRGPDGAHPVRLRDTGRHLGRGGKILWLPKAMGISG